MCPVCIASTAVMVAGAGSAGGILAVCIGKVRKFLRASGLGLVQQTSISENEREKGEMVWQQAKIKTKTSSRQKGISR
jgi:hypothetical protein